ncbi:hypothetical protein Salat_0298700 [Sesamum alatum]|uniref:Uncharacterized protein n=1 Tax=Sesamum alatum TaxID=300844 RepID=A0AAE2CYX7_9LAMI|nr:hypothetical protein Salat_0298700 [Sesamum alatum]
MDVAKDPKLRISPPSAFTAILTDSYHFLVSSECPLIENEARGEGHVREIKGEAAVTNKQREKQTVEASQFLVLREKIYSEEKEKIIYVRTNFGSETSDFSWILFENNRVGSFEYELGAGESNAVGFCDCDPAATGSGVDYNFRVDGFIADQLPLALGIVSFF